MRSTSFKGGLAKFVQTPHLVVILYQDLNYRQIHLDGRALPEVLHATWMGNSTGRWEGDTLVVESNGFNAASWLDAGGHPHTEALRITERFTRRDVGHMDVSLTFDDPEVYARPWTVSFAVELAPDTELIEAECNEVDPSEYRLSGRTAEQQSLMIPAEVLLRYVGTYDVRSRQNRDVIDYSLRFTIADDELRLDVDGAGNLPLVAVSTTMFSPPSGGVYEFVTDADGTVTHLVAHGVSGDNTGVRRK